MRGCPSEMELMREIDGLLNETEAASLRRHLAACPSCRRRAEVLLHFNASLQAGHELTRLERLVQQKQGCPPLAELHERFLGAESDSALEEHLRTCEACSAYAQELQSRFEELSAEDPLGSPAKLAAAVREAMGSLADKLHAAVAITLEEGRAAGRTFGTLLRDCMRAGDRTNLTPVHAVAMSEGEAVGPPVGCKLEGPEGEVEMWVATAGDQTTITLLADSRPPFPAAALVGDDGRIVSETGFEAFGARMKAQLVGPSTGAYVVVVRPREEQSEPETPS